LKAQNFSFESAKNTPKNPYTPTTTSLTAILIKKIAFYSFNGESMHIEQAPLFSTTTTKIIPNPIAITPQHIYLYPHTHQKNNNTTKL